MRNTIVVAMNTIAVLERKPRLEVKSRNIRATDRKVTSRCMNMVQNVRYVMGVRSIDSRTWSENAFHEQ